MDRVETKLTDEQLLSAIEAAVELRTSALGKKLDDITLVVMRIGQLFGRLKMLEGKVDETRQGIADIAKVLYAVAGVAEATEPDPALILVPSGVLPPEARR